jgi:NAD+ synthase
MVCEKIVNWLKEYNNQNKMSGFVVGISGGIDSALVSTLCAETGINTIAVSIPINQNNVLHERSLLQQNWLLNNYKNVSSQVIDLSQTFNVFKNSIETTDLGYANSKSRLRMIALYAVASRNNSLVVGTGNKVEDFGVGFFTKYGDGGVDISPIADLTKTQVFKLAKELNIPEEIQNAKPTDGLWDDSRTDEDQLGATYPELEWAMGYDGIDSLSKKQQEVLKVYNDFHNKNKHKMIPIPICKLT